jgi:hypothetical protein
VGILPAKDWIKILLLPFLRSTGNSKMILALANNRSRNAW